MASILKVNTIQDATNSTTAMTIDSSGRVTRSVIPRWKARTGPSTSAGYFGGTDTSTIGAREVSDPLSNYDASTRKYTVPITGSYFIFAQALHYSSTNGSIRLRVNGSQVQNLVGYTYSEGSVGSGTVKWSSYADLTVNDAIDIQCTGTNAWYSNGDDSYTFWGGYFIG